jgi:hypothetical protein
MGGILSTSNTPRPTSLESIPGLFILRNLSEDSDLKIVHFNDTYDIAERPQEPVGGAARFLGALNHLRKTENILVTFGGDWFFPSKCIHFKLSRITL